MAKLQPFGRARRWLREDEWTAIVDLHPSDIPSRVLALIAWRGEDDPSDEAIRVELAWHCADFLGIREAEIDGAIEDLVRVGALPKELIDGPSMTLEAVRAHIIRFVTSDETMARIARRRTRFFPLATTRKLVEQIFLPESRAIDDPLDWTL